MFGFVMADIKELSREEEKRYSSIYCGICRRMRLRAGGAARLGLSYDVTFLYSYILNSIELEGQ